MFAHLQRMPKVHDLIVRFLTDVNAGIYDLEKSLPPVRAVAKTYGVSIFTVHRAFDELKKAGLIRAEGKRASYINEDQLESLNRDNGNGAGKRSTGQDVTLLVRQYSDLRKLGTALVREKFYQHLRKIAPEITTREIQTDLSGGAFHMKLLNMMLAEANPTTG
ncbi:MAG: GntR family transcriptional regulator, partial [Lentisphaerota bacterium]